MRLPCNECLFEYGITVSSTGETAECCRCYRKWNLKWDRVVDGATFPKMTLVERDEEPWESLGVAVSGVLSSALVAKRNNMAGLQALMDASSDQSSEGGGA